MSGLNTLRTIPLTSDCVVFPEPINSVEAPVEEVPVEEVPVVDSNP